jgi:hypothetical protein
VNYTQEWPDILSARIFLSTNLFRWRWSWFCCGLLCQIFCRHRFVATAASNFESIGSNDVFREITLSVRKKASIHKHAITTTNIQCTGSLYRNLVLHHFLFLLAKWPRAIRHLTVHSNGSKIARAIISIVTTLALSFPEFGSTIVVDFNRINSHGIIAPQ